MINYETYCRIRIYHKEQGLTFSQIGRELGIDPETAAKYSALDTFPRRHATKRTSKLDAFKPAITRWLERHPYSATQIYQRLCADEGYTGGLSIVKAYVRAVRPARRPACRRPCRRSTPFSPTPRRTPTKKWWIACWPRRAMASAWRWIGWTPRATRTRTDSMSIATAKSGRGATG
jgi:hypothetical protein